MTLANSYLDVDGFKARTVAPASLVDGLHIPADKVADRAAWRMFVESQLKIETSKINARLRKRYAVPFADPAPEVVCGWLAVRVTPKLYERRGWDPSDAQSQALLADAKDALDEMKEAADSNEGLYDLPLRNDEAGDTAIAKGAPLFYSEASPYDFIDRQREARRQ